MRKLTSWLETYTEWESIDILSDLACEAAKLAGPSGPFIEHFIRTRDYKGLLETELISYEANRGPDYIRELRYARQALGFFQKLEFLDIGVDKRKAALDAYLSYERCCKETNEIFRLRSEGLFAFTERDEWILARAQRLIAAVLGEVPQLNALKLRFGPGATTSIPKREASTVRKLGTSLDCSEDLLPILATVLEEMPALAEYHGVTYLRYPDGSKWNIPTWCKNLVIKGDCEEWTSVPVTIRKGILSFALKNAKTYRTVEKQPILNGMVQLAQGDYMSRRCGMFGLDLTDQARNRKAARVGSLTGELATLDLKGASDTNAYMLVLETLPIDWVKFLADSRTGEIEDPTCSGKRIVLEKFSAMGNGYTFPLESLIFWALTHACLQFFERIEEGAVSNRTIEIYGDDIICPTEIVPIVRSALHTFGFIVNNEKSHWAGPFRESCGADFYSGTDIRPVYVKELVSPAVLFTMHNGLKARGMVQLAEKCASYIAPALKLWGPPGYGDGYLHSEAWPRTRESQHLARGFEGSTFRSFNRVPKRDIRITRDGEELLPQYSAYARSAEDLVPQNCTLKLGSFETLRRLKRDPRFMRMNLLDRFAVEAPSEPIPSKTVRVQGEPLKGVSAVNERDFFSDSARVGGDDWVSVKAPTFPGTDGYKVVSNYILDHGEV